MPITKIHTAGSYTLYKRSRGKEKTVPLYFIQETITTSNTVAEFKSIRQARNWFRK